MFGPVKLIAGSVLAAGIMLPTGTAMATIVQARSGGELVATARAPAKKDVGKIAVRDESAGHWVKAERN